MAKPCTPHLIAQRVQLFKLQARNANFLWEGVREGYLFFKKRYPSLIRIPCAAQGMDAALTALHESKGVFSFAKENTPFGTPRERLLIGGLGLALVFCLRNATACARRCRV